MSEQTLTREEKQGQKGLRLSSQELANLCYLFLYNKCRILTVYNSL